jgi:TonB-dependent SusC/RagA subfamily outer membrane receptor
MPTLHVSQFLIESSICLLLFYGFYGLVLRKETFFQLNRLYLLVTPLLSIAIPLIHVELYRPEVEPVVDPWVLLLLSQSAGLPDTLEQSVGGDIRVGDLLLAGYLLGLVLMLFRLGMAFRGLRRLLRGATHQLRGPAASFFGHILHRTNREDSERELLDAHERVHVREGHSLDILFMELMIAGYWFHPLIYGFRRQLKLIHEFIADARVVGQTGTRYAYARLLVRYSRTPIDHPLLNTFASFTKKRLLMLNQSPSPAYRRLKYLLALPLFICLLGLFSFDLAEELPSPILEPINVATATLDEVGQYELIPVLKPEANASLVVADTVPASAKKGSFIHVDRSNVLYLIDGERVSKAQVDDLDPQTIDRIEVLKGENAVEAYGDDAANGIVLIYTGAKGEAKLLDPGKNVLIKGIGSDSVKSANFMIRRVDTDTDQIKSILFKGLGTKQVDGQKIVSGVVTNEEGTPLIGASVLIQGTNQGTVTDIKGKFSMVVPDTEDVSLLVSYVGFESARIRLKGGVNSTSVVYGKSSPVDSVHTATFRIRGSESTENPLIMLNGEPQPQVKKVEELGIDPEEIASVNVVKISVGDKIGESLGRDVIEITTKDQVADRQTVTVNEAYLYVVDGEVIDKDDEQEALDIPPNRIKSVNVLKGEAATKKYGDQGENGVVEITTKKVDTNQEVVVKGYSVKGDKADPNEEIVVIGSQVKHDEANQEVTVTGKPQIRLRGNNPERPLFVIDGVKVLDKDETDVLKTIDPGDIESISVLKDKSATDKYGDQGENGVVEITTKSGAQKLKKQQKPAGTMVKVKPAETTKEEPTQQIALEEIIEEAPAKDLGFTLFPNPANETVRVQFNVPDGASAAVNLSVYDAEGKLVKVLRNGNMQPGPHPIDIKRSEVGSVGTYWVRLVVDGAVQTKQVVFN